MTMVNPNVMRAVGEVLESHHMTLRPGEPMSDAVARALKLSDSETEQWLQALSEGCTVEEANARTGIAAGRNSEPLMVSLARALGTGLGKIAR